MCHSLSGWAPPVAVLGAAPGRCVSRRRKSWPEMIPMREGSAGLHLPHAALHRVLAVSPSVMSNSLQPTRLLCPWDFPGQNTGVGGHFLLQLQLNIFRNKTQGILGIFSFKYEKALLKNLNTLFKSLKGLDILCRHSKKSQRMFQVFFTLL